MMRAHMSADTLEELRLASGAVFLGRRMAMQMDIVHNQARTARPPLEVFELREWINVKCPVLSTKYQIVRGARHSQRVSGAASCVDTCMEAWV